MSLWLTCSLFILIPILEYHRIRKLTGLRFLLPLMVKSLSEFTILMVAVKCTVLVREVTPVIFDLGLWHYYLMFTLVGLGILLNPFKNLSQFLILRSWFFVILLLSIFLDLTLANLLDFACIGLGMNYAADIIFDRKNLIFERKKLGMLRGYILAQSLISMLAVTYFMINVDFISMIEATVYSSFFIFSAQELKSMSSRQALFQPLELVRLLMILAIELDYSKIGQVPFSDYHNALILYVLGSVIIYTGLVISERSLRNTKAKLIARYEY